jgi:hypothetical protein
MAWNNLLNFLAGGTRATEINITASSYWQVQSLHEQSPYAADKQNDFVVELVVEACRRADAIPVKPLVEALGQVVDDLLNFDGLIFGFPQGVPFEALSADEAVALRTYLDRKERFLRDHHRLADLWREKVIRLIEALLQHLPPTAFRESWDHDDPDEGIPGATVSLVEVIERPAELIERLIVTFRDQDVSSSGLFEPLRAQFERRILVASDIDWEERHRTRRKLILPTQSPQRVPSQLATLYLQGTPWLQFFQTQLPFAIPFPARFEHTHILGGSGHGKTQLLQLQIVRDLIESAADGRSVVVMDSQGDLIRTISQLEILAPGAAGGLSERVMLIDPADVEFPVALNMFDADRQSMEAMPLLERERILNATVDLYEYFFGALLGAELTNRQGIIFKYLARLLLEIPDATIHTFRQLMENGEAFRPYMDRLPSTSRAFFEERFFDRSFNETKKQVLTRLWGVLSNATFDRMFSHPRSKVKLFEALQEGRIVLINTAKDLLKDEGASILGRFFIALIAQVALRRASLPAHERRPCFVYVDEAADYFDDKIGHLLNQARKYKVGMVLAHQNLDQLTPALRASVFSSTSIKYAGGVSGKDAVALSSEMHVDDDFLLAQRKQRKSTSFACYVRNVTPQSLSISIPLGTVERLQKMTDAQFAELRDASRAAYCIPLSEVPAPTPVSRRKVPSRTAPPEPAEPPAKEPTRQRVSTPTVAVSDDAAFVVSTDETAAPAPSPAPARPKKKPPPAPPPLGGGGKEHKYIANLIREFAQSKGFLATVEETILEGAGRVDVSLTKGKLRVACEISVTNGRDYELGNIEKCLAADYAFVLFVSSDRRHRSAMEKLSKEHLEEKDLARVHFCAPEEALERIAVWAGPEVTETTVRGYKVKTRQTVLDPEEAARRRDTVASVIARSLRESKRE